MNETPSGDAEARSLVQALQSDTWQVALRNLSHTVPESERETLKPAYRSVLIERLLPEIQSDYLLIVDGSYDHQPAWFQAALLEVVSGRADVVVAPRASRDFFGKTASTLVERLTSSHSAASPAVVARRETVTNRLPSLRPAGRWFSLEMQLRVPDERRMLLANAVPTRKTKPVDARLGHTELSFLKSFIDHKYGNISRLVQFCAVGFSGMIVDLTLYAMFQSAFRDTALKSMTVPLIGGSGDLALAGLFAVWLAMTWNFLINRRVTFNDARKNSSILRQYLTYATGNALAIGVSLVIRLWLPTQVAFFNDHKLVAALVGIVLATGISFSMARYFVFKS